MKKILSILIIGIVLGSCTKDKGEEEYIPPYEKRLLGSWNLTKVTYEAQLPSIPPGGPTTPVSGDGAETEGTFIISRKPNTVEYDYSFIVSVPVMGQDVSIPVEQKSSGTWTISSDNSKIYLELENDVSSTLEVIEDRENKQVFRSIIPFEVNLLGTVDVTTTITLER